MSQPRKITIPLYKELLANRFKFHVYIIASLSGLGISLMYPEIPIIKGFSILYFIFSFFLLRITNTRIGIRDTLKAEYERQHNVTLTRDQFDNTDLSDFINESIPNSDDEEGLG